MFQGCGTALVTPFRADLSLDEEALRRLVRRQIEAGHPLPGPLRHHRREPHAHPRGAPARGRDHARRVQRQGPRARRRRRLQHPRGHRAGPRPRGARGGRPALRHPLLQQAHAGGPLPALPRRRPRHPPADRGLQRAGPHRRQRRAGDARAAWPRSRPSSASRKPRATSPRWRPSSRPSPRTSPCSRATTPSPSRSSRSGASASSRWSRTRSPPPWRG